MSLQRCNVYAAYKWNQLILLYKYVQELKMFYTLNTESLSEVKTAIGVNRDFKFEY